MAETEFIPVGCAVLTMSDTRTFETDKSGDLIVEHLTTLGHPVRDRRIVPDDITLIRQTVARWVADPEIDVVITTGGTGITRRDVTPEAVAPLGTRHITGFGELFRMLSWEDIGSSTVQSRAEAWLCTTTLVFVLPGSSGAVRLAMEKILVEQLDVRHRPCNFIQLLPRIKGEARG